MKQKAEAAGYTVTEQPFTASGGKRSSNVLAEFATSDSRSSTRSDPISGTASDGST
ncbi:hypothetical protein EV193_11735 [Herbihabitans rhizosphaerae]|uniref:Uncharacterized protein n=1 Tax=Herbihabitans rhizosphaerae TaxID=1872711 RepID=A0A4Q7KDA9_9PSEU|nr:hypothetical protein [Herbihabitans rhizosphaerae]RZS30339.1 hypothetical protein EV193_11735 [Herbihabitans rhizosphaerae]